MIELSRRLFLIGSSAAIAVAALPAAIPVPAQTAFTKRLLDSFDVSWDASIPQKGLLTISRIAGLPIMRFGYLTTAILHWSASPGNEIVVLPDRLLQVEITHGPGEIHLYCRDWYANDSEPIPVLEKHFFPKRPPETYPLDTRDVDRLARHTFK